MGTEQGMVIRFMASCDEYQQVFLSTAVKFEMKYIWPPNWRFVTHLIEPFSGLNQQPLSDFPHCTQQGAHMYEFHEKGVWFNDGSNNDTLGDVPMYDKDVFVRHVQERRDLVVTALVAADPVYDLEEVPALDDDS